MLSFFTEFPVTSECDTISFLAETKEWILKSPHTSFKDCDLSYMNEIKEESFSTENQKISIIQDSKGNIAFKNIIQDRSLEWSTTIVRSSINGHIWVSIRTSVESSSPIIRLPAAKKPIICKTLISKFSGAPDGELQVKNEPHFLTEEDLDIAAKIINSQCENRLPIVYVSTPFRGELEIDVRRLAYDLSGMAHIMVEPSRVFSKKLMKIVCYKNVYGGAIGIYWPNVSQRKTFFTDQFIEDGSNIRTSLFDYIRQSLLNRRPLPMCTWSSVQEDMSRYNYNKLKENKSQDIEKYIETFDSEIAAKDEKISESENEVARLSSELKKYEEESGYKSYIKLNCGKFRDLYNEEMLSIVMDAIKNEIELESPISRGGILLKEIYNNNVHPSGRREIKEKIKRILKGYKKLDSNTRRELEEVGFSISEDGKHYKIVFCNDEKLSFSLSKTSSDHRAGLNLASDICKML